ncbi:hypothetical protein PHYSODRAFT_332808 [Phytophthora sojae]|uniref:FYVE-type domain-containing protein n=1 Tax=Phytophthora sojae (strain P6497) TaxID=1094619 RepID=G4ZQ26_PHYSP|nr:hypothetical protein PHYSODRAFT_332808 [Phytophthora sojae]EGZ14415.1 hypothetical protein PHYSODRAFT_332808 [Phytophthora sojae]|eukprot:XP_009528164.1 hypothetical protein PHYSODRAFT_332808 [Phytophthora sojae]
MRPFNISPPPTKQRKFLMQFPLPRNIFPVVELPLEQVQTLENNATSVVREIRDYYYDFLTTHHERVDLSEWKKLTTSSVSLMLAVGSLDGTVEDCMLGLQTPTSQRMQLKSAMPSPSQPFHEVAVKWAVEAHPFLVGTVMRVRDIVYLETTGFTTITGPDGAKQPLGYHLKHSIDLPDVHELTEFGIVRARLSYCYLYRQRSERVVDVFLRGFVCAMGDAPESLVVSTVTEIVMSIPKNLECAKMYKLAYLLKRATPPLKSSGSCKECSLCKRTVKPAAPGDIHKICCVCCARVCSSCRVVHKMLKVSPYKPGVTSEKMTFCVRCVRTASEISAALVAAHSVRDADADALPEHG